MRKIPVYYQRRFFSNYISMRHKLPYFHPKIEEFLARNRTFRACLDHHRRSHTAPHLACRSCGGRIDRRSLGEVWRQRLGSKQAFGPIAVSTPPCPRGGEKQCARAPRRQAARANSKREGRNLPTIPMFRNSNFTCPEKSPGIPSAVVAIIWKSKTTHAARPGLLPSLLLNFEPHLRSSIKRIAHASLTHPIHAHQPPFSAATRRSGKSPEIRVRCDGGMDALPDGVVQHILSQLSNARDVAACAAVARCWRDCMPFLPSLYFPRGAFESVGVGPASAVAAADDVIGRMVDAAARLEELVVYCPFSASLLPHWLAARAATLRVLELRVESAADDKSGHLDSIGVATSLEELRLWALRMTRAPAWGQMERLRVLEVVGAVLEDAAVNGAVAACPNLTDLALLGCECAGEAVISLAHLERCRLDFVGSGNTSLRFAAPRVSSLEVQGFSLIYLQGGNRLKHLTISKNTGTVRRSLCVPPQKQILVRITLPDSYYSKIGYFR
jgi:hypothetical protein